MAEPMFHVYADNKGRVMRTDDELTAHVDGMTLANEDYRIDYMNTFGDTIRVGSGERDTDGLWTVHQMQPDCTDSVFEGVDANTVGDYLTLDDDE